MWTRFYCLLLLTVFLADAASIDFPLDPKNIEDNGLILQSRLQISNNIVSLSESHNVARKALLEMIERQEKQETKLSELEANRKYFSNSDERQEKLETKLLQFIEKSEKSFVNLKKRQDKLEAKLLEFMEKSEKYFLNSEERQEKLEIKLLKFMEQTEKHFSNFEEKQLSSTVESTENNLMTMKNGQIPGNSNGDQNLEKNVEWTTVARRQDGSVDFNRNWTEYENGFGNPDGEFFIGLEKLHNLTTQGDPQELLLVMIFHDFPNEERIAKYDKFKIGSVDANYELLELGKYSGDAGDGLSNHKNMKFSTSDNDNDGSGFNCAEVFEGGWWYDNCVNSRLFGYYNENGSYGIEWSTVDKYLLKFVEMKIRTKF